MIIPGYVKLPNLPMDHFTATIPDEAHSPGAVLWVAAPLSMLLRIIYYTPATAGNY